MTTLTMTMTMPVDDIIVAALILCAAARAPADVRHSQVAGSGTVPTGHDV